MTKDSATAPLLSEREARILHTLVSHYIEDGAPVASGKLSQAEGICCSSATVRNVMVDLEEKGLLNTPHTSAGRIPTQQAYRLFVDRLVVSNDVKTLLKSQLTSAFSASLNRDDIIKSVSERLSGVTKMAGLITLPTRTENPLRQVEFLPLSERRVLVILVDGDDEVENRIIQTDRNYSAAELTEAANYINQNHGGKSINNLREALRQDLLTMHDTLQDSTRQMLDAASAALSPSETDDKSESMLVAGQMNLLNFTDLSDVDRVREMFEAFQSKYEILKLLERSLSANGVQIFIGQESGVNPLAHCSVVTAPYSKDGKIVGVLGVVGPTRMAYERVIPTVDIASKMLSAALNQQK